MKTIFEMVKGCRIDIGCAKGFIKKASFKNTWIKGKLRNRYRHGCAKGKADIGLDEHRAIHT